MSETKAFPTASVLSAITGVLVGPIDGVYEILSWMTGESVYTHQIPRIGQEARDVIVAMRPDLNAAIAESAAVNPTNWQDWLATWVERYGQEIIVPRMSTDDHERIDPLSELAEKFHPDKIMVVKP
jgi:hypothetical protein